MADGWDVKVTAKPMTEAQKRALSHHPAIVAQLAQLAAEIAAVAGSGHTPGDFGIRVQNWPNTRRARAFAIPANSGGIHLELTQHLLVKAAASSTNKTITKKASGGAAAMGAKQGESGGTVVGTTIQPTSSP